MIQDMRHTEQQERQIDAAKTNLKSAARRKASRPRTGPAASPKHAALYMATQNPGATGAVAFALIAAVGPRRLFKATTFALRTAPLAAMAFKALESKLDEEPRRGPWA